MSKLEIVSSNPQSREELAFGCTEQEAREGIDALNKGCFGNANLALSSMLSDVQELLVLGKDDNARKVLNRIKFALFYASPIKLWERGP